MQTAGKFSFNLDQFYVPEHLDSAMLRIIIAAILGGYLEKGSWWRNRKGY